VASLQKFYIGYWPNHGDAAVKISFFTNVDLVKA